MKKLFILLTIVSSLLVSCGEKKNSGLGDFNYDTTALVGTWKATEANGVEWLLQETTFTFGKDGSYSCTGIFGTFNNGIYKLSDNKVISYVLGQKQISFVVKSLSANNFVFVVGDVPDHLEITCTK